MKKLLTIIAVLFLTATGYSQTVTTQAAQGFCSTGGAKVMTQGVSSTTAVQVSYPKCSVEVFLTGTSNHATIFSNGSGGTLGNPFTANADASWRFWAATGVGYDIVMSGGTPTPFPAPFTLVSVMLGGGGSSANPGGVNSEVQLNLNGTAFGGSGLFRSISGNPTFASGTYFSANPLGLGVLNGASVTGTSQFSNKSQCMQSAVFAGGLGSHLCNFEIDSHFEPGWNVGNQNQFGNQGWTVNKSHVLFGNYFTSGITQVINVVAQFNKEGDDAAFYAYCRNKGGWVDISGEGHTCLRLNGGNEQKVDGGGSTITDTGMDTLTLSDNSTGDGNLLVDGYLMNVDATPLASGQITGLTNPGTNVPGQFTTSDTHPISSAIGVTNAAINITAPSVPAGVSLPISVHVTGGSNAGGFTLDANPRNTVILFACDNFPDWVRPTSITPIDGSGNQTITGAFNFGHGAGCKVFQGGPQGIIDFVADRLLFGGLPNVRSGHLIAGAEDATHLSYRMYITGSQGIIPPFIHDFGESRPINLTRAANTVTACTPSTNYAGQQIEISGAGDSSFNGPFTASNLIAATGCISWTQAGANASTSGTISTGGTVGGMTGSGAYFVWPTARVKSQPFVTTVANGISTLTPNGLSANLYPNNMHVNVGDHILQPMEPANKTIMLSALASYSTPPTQGHNSHFLLAINGSGISTSDFRGDELQNQNNFNMYQGGGGSGQLQGAQGRVTSGPWATTFWSDPPLSGGVHDFINTNAPLDAGNAWYGYYMRAAAQQGGNFGFSEFYNPVTRLVTVRNSSQSAPVGDCIYTMSSTTINFSQCNMTVQTPATATNNTTVANTAYVKAAIAAAAPPAPAAGALTGTTLAPGVTASSLTSTAGGTLQAPAFTSGGLTTSFTITTTTGTCTFGYTNGLLTTKTGSC